MRETIESMLCTFLEENDIATEDETRLVADINGFTEETMLDILFARTGNRNVEQAYDEGYLASNELLDYYGLREDEEEDEDDEG